MSTTMPTLNGARPSPSPPQTTTAKRKRADSPQHPQTVLLHDQKAIAESHSSVEVIELEIIRDIHRILASHDTPPSVLQHIIPSPTILQGETHEPPTKRTKLSTLDAVLSVSEKVQDQLYRSVDEFASDVEASCTDLLLEARSKSNGAHWEYTPSSPDQDRLIAKITTFQELLKNLVRREAGRGHSTYNKAELSVGKGTKQEFLANGVKREGDTDGIHTTSDTQRSRTVLTLFGNAQGHKQLFSSFQKPVVNTQGKEHLKDDTPALSVLSKAIVPVRENGLPNGISSSRILPITYKPMSTTSQTATIFDTFAPPSTTLPLIPPKTPRPALARQNSITWTHSSASTASKNVIGYTHQKLTVGHWLGYDGVTPSHDAASPETKRKQRDRTLSTGESGSSPSEATLAAQTQAKEDALFRSAYSSFAPSCDNTGAIFPEDVRNQLWWQRVGSRHIDQISSTNLSYTLTSPVVNSATDGDADDEELTFKKIVESFEPEVYTPGQKSENAENTDKDGEELLLEISELLEILYSYQRIRNSFLNTNARSSVGQNSPLQDLMGSPSTPSTAEIETYNALKAQLALIVSLLPPHAVAKLNGEQLEELQISLQMPYESPIYRGTMEDDQASRVAKAAAFNAAIGPTTQSRQGAVMTPTALQYSSGQARTAQMTAPSRSNTQQYYAGAPPSLSRQTSSFSRQPLSSWQSAAQNYSSPTTHRPSYVNQHSYGQQQTSRAAMPNIIRPSLSQYPQSRSIGATHQTNGNYNNTTPSQPAYQQRAQTYVPNTNYNFKPSYTAAAYNAAQTPQSQQHQNSQQYSRGSYLLPQPTQSVSPAPTASGVSGNGQRPQTPATPLGQISMGVQKGQIETPGPVGQAAVPPVTVAGVNTRETPQA